MSRRRTKKNLLQLLLDQYYLKQSMKPNELAEIHEHLFDPNISLPFVQDADLHETIFYLSYIIAEMRLGSLEQLQAYQNGKRREARKLLEQMMAGMSLARLRPIVSRKRKQ